MPHTRRRVPLSLAIALASAGPLFASDAPGRVTIRGGADGVVVEGRPTRVLKRAEDPSREILAHAIQLRQSSADDSVMLAYLRAHASDLPALIEASDVARLRRAGAGQPVIAYLATVSAVDVGPTGEGHPMPVMMPAAYEPLEMGGIPAEYANYGTYGGYWGSSWNPNRRHFRPPRPHPEPFRHPHPQPPMPGQSTRNAVGRFPE